MLNSVKSQAFRQRLSYIPAMKRQRKTFYLLLGLISIAFVGLIGLQVVLLDHAWELKTQSFRQNVSAALASVVQKIETHELTMSVVAFTLGDSAAENEEFVNWFNQSGADSLGVKGRLQFVNRSEFRSQNLPDSAARWMKTLPDLPIMTMTVRDTLINDSLKIIEKVRVSATDSVDSIRVPIFADRQIVKTEESDTASTTHPAHFTMAIKGSRRQILISKVLDQLESANTLPLAARIKLAVLDSIVQVTLRENGIDMPYAYGVHARKKDEFEHISSTGMEDNLRTSEYRTPLFPHDIFAGQQDLVVYFPDQKMFLFQQTAALFVASFLLMTIVVFGFVYAVGTIFRQQRFASSLTSFINNMTHEFKTPISTISLAAEAMSSSVDVADQKRLTRYTQIIRDENSRMREQVEKILQMSVLERGEYELNLDEVDVHETIRTAIANIALQVEKRGGQIISDLSASVAKIKADALHLANIIHNLLDNANKYTPQSPQITVSTRSDTQGIRIQVADNGIGLRSEDQKRIFEKYFRVSTGNVHDVKGFGLGLSYVRMMVEAHGGRVEVRSEINRGATFEVFLPFIPDTARQN